MLLDEPEERGGGILHLETEHFTRLGIVMPVGRSIDSPRRSSRSFRLPEQLINDSWLLFREDGSSQTVSLTRGEDGEFISRTGPVDGEYVFEHVPSGTIERRGESTESLSVLAGYREALQRGAEDLRGRVVDGQMTVERSGNASTIVLVYPRTGCGGGMSSELPSGTVEERIEVTEADYVYVYITCIVTTADGRKILVNEVRQRWERLDADRWDDIVSFVFGG